MEAKARRFKGQCTARGVSLPDDLWLAIQERAQQEDLPVSRIIRRATVRELGEHDQIELAQEERCND